MDDGAGAAREFDAGRIVAALGAIALLIGLFLDWYSAGGAGFGESASAWAVFEIVDLLLALLAVGVLLAVVSTLAPAALLPPMPATSVAVAGVAALVLVTVSLVDDPPAAIGASLEEGIWLAFGGALLIVIGAVLERSRIRLVVTPREGRSPEGDEPVDEAGEPGGSAEHPASSETREFPPP